MGKAKAGAAAVVDEFHPATFLARSREMSLLWRSFAVVDRIL